MFDWAVVEMKLSRFVPRIFKRRVCKILVFKLHIKSIIKYYHGLSNITHVDDNMKVSKLPSFKVSVVKLQKLQLRVTLVEKKTQSLSLVGRKKNLAFCVLKLQGLELYTPQQV